MKKPVGAFRDYSKAPETVTVSVLGITGRFPLYVNSYSQLFEFVVHGQVTHCLKFKLNSDPHYLLKLNIGLPYRFVN
jgi:hypothetical protein